MCSAVAAGRRDVDGTDYGDELGFDAKYSITPSLTLDCDLQHRLRAGRGRRDSGQPRSFQPVLSRRNGRSSLENAGQFSVGSPREVELFFSRRIGVGAGGVQQPIDGGLRSRARSDARPTSASAYARRGGERHLAAERLLRRCGSIRSCANRSPIGGICRATRWRWQHHRRRRRRLQPTYALDGRWGIGDNLDVSGYVAKTETPGCAATTRPTRLRAEYNSEAWIHPLGYTKVGKTSIPRSGSCAEQLSRRASSCLRRYRPDDSWGLHELRPHIAYSGYWDDEGFWEIAASCTSTTTGSGAAAARSTPASTSSTKA